MKHSHFGATLLPFALSSLFLSSFFYLWWCWGHIWKFRSLAELLIFWLNTRHGDLSALQTKGPRWMKKYSNFPNLSFLLITFCHRRWSHFLFLPICCFWFALCVCVCLKYHRKLPKVLSFDYYNNNNIIIHKLLYIYLVLCKNVHARLYTVETLKLFSTSTSDVNNN